MKDISLLEKILGKFLSREQIVALVEEISKGVSVVSGVIDKNEKVKAKKEFVVETFKSIDRMIAQSNKIPATLKFFYDTAKVKIHDLLEPIITGMIMENDFSNLDDIPDVKKTDSAPKQSTEKQPQVNANSQQPANGEQQGGGRRRRNRRHGRNRNNNHNVETFHETSLPTEPEPASKPEPVQKQEQKTKPAPEPEPKQIPKPVSKPAPKQAPKPVETFHETSLTTESKPKPAKRGRTPKKNVEKTESVQPESETTPKKRTNRRKPKETNE